MLAGFALRAYNVSSQGHWNSDGLLYYELARGFLFDGKVLSGNAVLTIISRNNLESFDHLFLQGKFGHILLILTAFLLTGIRMKTVLYLNVALGTATLYLIYLLGKQVFNREAGLTVAGLAVGFAFTIHYNLAYYFFLLYFSHLAHCLFSKKNKRRLLQENFLLAAAYRRELSEAHAGGEDFGAHAGFGGEVGP